ncbi:hypothetical protein PPAR_a3211 [Pseudoalteromonas paragorgicola KMM 3548]|nr:hypothetical protein [Pseudoalteromonas distincta KMM 3548]
MPTYIVHFYSQVLPALLNHKKLARTAPFYKLYTNSLN